MSETSGFTDSLSEAETKEVFKRLNAVKPCPACGHARWIMMVDAEDSAAIVLVPRSQQLPREHLRYMPLSVMLCENCAFVRPHATAILQAKLAEARGKEGDRDSD